MSTNTDLGLFDVRDFGADESGKRDSTAAFDAAINRANSVGNGATVLVPGGGGSYSYKISRIELNHRTNGDSSHCCNLLGVGNPKIVGTVQNEGLGVIEFSQGLHSLADPLAFIRGIELDASGAAGVSGIAIWSGNRVLVEDCIVSGAPQHGVSVQAGWFDNGWVEGACLRRCQVFGCREYSYHWALEDAGYNVFITESGMEWCTSRIPGKGSMLIEMNNTRGGNYKISNFHARKCEFDCTGGSSANGIDIVQNSTNAGNIIENIAITESTIEDAGNGSHSGHAVGITSVEGGALVGPLKLDIIHYGFAQGAVDTSKITQGRYDIQAPANGDASQIR